MKQHKRDELLESILGFLSMDRELSYRRRSDLAFIGYSLLNDDDIAYNCTRDEIDDIGRKKKKKKRKLEKVLVRGVINDFERFKYIEQVTAVLVGEKDVSDTQKQVARCIMDALLRNYRDLRGSAVEEGINCLRIGQTLLFNWRGRDVDDTAGCTPDDSSEGIKKVGPSIIETQMEAE